jgi:hypothetical protein
VDRSWFSLVWRWEIPLKIKLIYLARWKGEIAYLGYASPEGLGGA